MINANASLNQEDAEIREVYARFGLAIYQAQCIEREMALVLTVSFKPRPRNAREFEALLERRYRKTLGALVTELRKADNRADELEAPLLATLEKRNWLAHHYFWDRAATFMTSKGRHAMVDELKLIAEEFDSLDKRLSEITERWRKKVGITDDVIEAQMKKLTETT
jgi:hypothetical protein